ncbi:MAG: PTS sugar transporter subunit IIB [Anaerolineaceae bacterium]|nr:PTS sugar transporter subunit IIB [Anaerolineaceae bacterium]
MSVVLYRIDDRLIHGQVMTAWTKVYSTTRIFVVDDETAANKFLCDVMNMAIPDDYQVSIYKVVDAVQAIKNDPPNVRTLVLAKSTEAMLQLAEAGVGMKELNVGNIGSGPGRKAIMRSTQLSRQEFDQLTKIQDLGVRVYLQVFPDAKSLEFSKCTY